MSLFSVKISYIIVSFINISNIVRKKLISITIIECNRCELLLVWMQNNFISFFICINYPNTNVILVILSNQRTRVTLRSMILDEQSSCTIVALNGNFVKSTATSDCHKKINTMIFSVYDLNFKFIDQWMLKRCYSLLTFIISYGKHLFQRRLCATTWINVIWDQWTSRRSPWWPWIDNLGHLRIRESCAYLIERS